MHTSAEYMLPGEFAVVVAFLLFPALVIALAAQSFIFAARGLFVRASVPRVLAGYMATSIGTLLLAAAIHQLAPAFLGPLLRVRDLHVGDQSWPVMPLAFIAAAGAAVASTCWVLGRGRPEA